MAKDFLGRKIEQGDLIVYPVREGSRMVMVLARVRYQRRQPYNRGGLEVDRLLHQGRKVGQRVRCYVQRTDRVTIVDESTIPEDVLNKMKDQT